MAIGNLTKERMPLLGLMMKPTLWDWAVATVFGIGLGYFLAVYFTGV
jgi:hypothetical protein